MHAPDFPPTPPLATSPRTLTVRRRQGPRAYRIHPHQYFLLFLLLRLWPLPTLPREHVSWWETRPPVRCRHRHFRAPEWRSRGHGWLGSRRVMGKRGPFAFCFCFGLFFVLSNSISIVNHNRLSSSAQRSNQTESGTEGNRTIGGRGGRAGESYNVCQRTLNIYRVITLHEAY